MSLKAWLVLSLGWLAPIAVRPESAGPDGARGVVAPALGRFNAHGPQSGALGAVASRVGSVGWVSSFCFWGLLVVGLEEVL